MSWTDLERLVVDAEASVQLQGVLRRCSSRNELLQTARRLGYRVTKGDLRQAWLQHLQAAEDQKLSQPQPASGQIRSQQQPIGCGTGMENSTSCRATCTG